MEKPLTVLIDPETRKICLYGEYNREFLLEEMHILRAFLKDRNAMVVMEATEMNGEESVEYARSILEQLPPSEPTKRFFRVNVEGYTTIPELNIRFSGSKDFKPVDQFGRDVFDRSPTLFNLLKSGKLEILDEEEVAKLKKPKPRAKAESIILDKPVRDQDGNFFFENDTIFTEDNEITEDTVIETDEEEVIKKVIGKKTE